MVTIESTLSADHERLDQLYGRFQECTLGAVKEAGEAFLKFRTGLMRHLIWEEEVLLPMFDEKSDGSQGSALCEEMKQEHRFIRGTLRDFHAQLLAPEGGAGTEFKALSDSLSAHHAKEESLLYPALDRLITDSERDRLLLAWRWKRFPL